MFKAVLRACLQFLGISAFAKDANGKSMLTADQEKKLADKYGDKFVSQFKADLADFEKDGTQVDSVLTEEMDAQALAQIEADRKELAEFRVKYKALIDKVEKMSKEPVTDKTEEIDGDGTARKAYTPDMALPLNKNFYAAANKGYQYNSNGTIDTEDLRKEFGRYVSAEKLAIFQKLLNPTNSMQYMSTIITDKFQVKASQSSIGSVLQSFVPKWTPKGSSKFTPLTIEQYPMKINVSIIPSDIINDVLGYLYDESLDPKDMPIVRYIVEQLIRPKLEEDREVACAIGRYKEPAPEADGSYKANDVKDTCDGYLTQLVDQYQNAGTAVNFLLKDTALGEGETLLANIEKAVDLVTPAYKNKVLTIHADPDLIIKYARAYRDKYPTTKNEDGKKLKVDYTNFTFAGLEGMRGTGAFFITPKENFKHLMSRNPQSQTLRMATEDYEAKIFGEWREGFGFWIAEAIFAYLPAALVNKLKITTPGEGA